ncbi:TPA: penicillin-binding protein activator LpoB, partial [bacterium]|nr:penicillin-binding protein activator LpoB [bacterium]
VSQEMIRDCLNHTWIGEHMTAKAKKPVIIVGSMRNRSSEHIAVKTFVNDIERAFINSGQVTVVASAGDREEMRSEKEDQRVFASVETIKQMGKELGADFMMTGEVNTIVDQEEGKKVIFYQVDLTLTNIETNVKVWLGQKKIKKFISRSRYSS